MTRGDKSVRVKMEMSEKLGQQKQCLCLPVGKSLRKAGELSQEVDV